MTEEESDGRWERMWELFHECTHLPEKERADVLEVGCAEDPAMWVELLELLGEYDRPMK
jgi:hypothetical protein